MIYDLFRVLDMREVLIVGLIYVDYADGCWQNGVACWFGFTRERDGFKIKPDRLQDQIQTTDTVY